MNSWGVMKKGKGGEQSSQYFSALMLSVMVRNSCRLEVFTKTLVNCVRSRGTDEEMPSRVTLTTANGNKQHLWVYIHLFNIVSILSKQFITRSEINILNYHCQVLSYPSPKQNSARTKKTKLLAGLACLDELDHKRLDDYILARSQ